MRKILHVLCLILPVITAIGCSQSNNPVAPDQAPTTGQLLFALDAADNIASGTVTITKGNLTHVLPITITNHTGSVTFNNIQVGHWNIQVQLFDADGVEIYSGDGTAIVTKNQTTTATIHVNHNTGNLTIVVNTDLYFDDFENPATLANYDYSTSLAVIANGYLNFHGVGFVKDSLLSSALSDVTVECDIKSLVDNNHGIQGIYLRHSNTDGCSYYFNWNDNPYPAGGVVEWQIVKYGADDTNQYTFLATSKTPVYNVGNWVHIKAVARGNQLELWVDQHDGNGLQLILSATDNAYTSGKVGFRTGWVIAPNETYFDNLRVY